MEALIGNNTGSTLNLPITGSIVSITGTNDGTVMNAGTMNFTDFNIVVFGAGDDDITVQAGGSLTSSNTINGGAGDDTLTVDFTGNVPLAFAGGMLTFNGGENAGDHDVVRLTGYDFTTNPIFSDGNADVTVTHTGTEAGNVLVGPVGTRLGTVNFTETEPLVLAGTAADLVINLPATQNPDVLFADDTAANFPGNGANVAGRSAIDGSTFEYTEFTNPTNTLRINLGANSDTITVGALDGAFAATAGTTILGGAGGDTFNVGAATPAGTNIDLQGAGGNDVFNIAAVLTGEVNGQAGSDTLRGTLINLVVLNGGTADGFDGTEDSITAGFNGIETIIADAATANTTLTGRNDSSTWTLNTGGATGRYDDNDGATPQLNYQNFDTLQGGDQSDQFLVTAASNFNLNGGDGADSFDIGAALTGTIAGGLGDDALLGNLITAVTLTTSAANGYAGNEADINGGAASFTGINTITASPTADASLSGENTTSTWTLNGAPTYNDGAGNGVLNFSGFETLSGGSGDDSFLVTVDPNDGAGTVGTTLFGNDGDDLFDIDVAFQGQIQGGGVGPATDLDSLTGDIIDDVVLVSSDNEGFNGTENSITPVAGNGFLGIDRITTTAAGNSRLTGRDIGSTWSIAGAASIYTDGTRTLPIDLAFDSLQGGSNNDVFNVTAASDFDLFGGLGSDTFTVGAVTLSGSIDGQGASGLLQGAGIVNVTLASSNANGFTGQEDNITGGFAGIDNIINTSGGGTLTGRSAVTSTWTLDGSPTYSAGGNTLDFSGFATLQGRDGVDNFTASVASPFTLRGGDGADTFTLNAALTAGNSINGEAGGDTLSGTAISNVTLTGASGVGDGFSGTQGSIPAGFAGINVITGTGAGTLTGANDGTSVWTLNGGTEQYTASGETLDFTGFPTLQGGTAIDTFNVIGAVAATLRGGDGNDQFNLSANLTGTIFGEAGANDSVNFLNGGLVTGNIDLGTSGILDFSAQNNRVLLTVIAAGSIDGFQLDNDNNMFFTGTANNITTIIGSANAGVTDVLTGLSLVSTWNLNGNGVAAHNYAVTGRNMNFSGFEGVQGGSDNDTFNVNVNTSGTFLNGGNGNDTYNINATLTDLAGNIPIFAEGGVDTLQGTLIDSVVLTNSDNNGFDGTEDSLINTAGQSFDDIEVIIGNSSATSSLTGENNAATWALNAAPRYNNDGVNFLTFGGFTNLRGGSDTDAFIVTANTTANLDGGGGNAIDVVLLINRTLTGTISLGAGVDIVEFFGNGNVTGLVDGGADGASLGYAGATGPITVQLNQNGSLTGFEGAATSTGGFDNITNVIGSSGSDTLTSNLAAVNTPTFAIQGLDGGLVNNGPTAILTFGIIENLNGGAGAEQFVFDGGSLSGNVTGGGGSDTLDYQTLAGPVTVDFNSGLAGAASLIAGTVTGIENAIGTGSGDTFTGDSASANTFTGLDGDDTYNFVVNVNTAAADIVVDSTGSDTINFSGTTIPINLDLDRQTPQPGSTAGTYDVILNGQIENFVGSTTQNDTLFVNANALAGFTRTLTGGGQTTADTLAIDATGLMVTMLTAGSLAFSNGAVINFMGWEAVNLVGVASITLDAAALAGLTAPLNLTNVGDLVLTGIANVDDNVALTAASANSGTLIVNGNALAPINFTNATGFTFNGQSGDGLGPIDDALGIVNPAVGLFNPTNGINFNAGGSGVLGVIGGTANAVEHIFTNNNDGMIRAIGTLGGMTVPVYVYTGLAPITDTITATNRTFTFNGGAETIDLTDDAVAGQMMIDSTLGESVVFTLPTGLLTINSNVDTDVINLTSVDAAFNASFSVNGDIGDGDTITLGTSLNLGSAVTTGNLVLTADTINLGTGTPLTINTDGAGSTNAGNVTLNANATINIDQNVTIDTNHAVGTDGTLTVGGASFNAVTGGLQSLTLDLGTTSFDGSQGANNDYFTVVILSAATVSLSDNTGIVLGNINMTGNLNVVADSVVNFNSAGASTIGGTMMINAGLNVTDAGSGSLTVTGLSTLLGATFVTLDNAGNNFSTVVLPDGQVLNAIFNDTGAINIDPSSLMGSLTITAGGAVAFTGVGTTIVGNGLSVTTTGGGITQAANLTVNGNTTLTGGAGVITLTNIANDFLGTVGATNTGTNAIQITDANAVDLGTVTTTNVLTVIALGSGATGTITDTGVITVGGTTTLIAGNDIILDSVNTFTGTVQVSLTSAVATDRDLTLVDTTALQLDNLTPASDLRVNNLNVTALGITQADTLIVDGTANLNGGAAAITLADAGNDFLGQFNANNTGANAITLADVNSIDLGTVTTANNLSVTAGAPGSITDSGTITVGGLTTLTANGGSIVLDNANTFTGLVQVSLAATGDLTLNDTTALNLENQTVGVQTVTVNNLNITALGITQTDNFQVNGITTLNGLTGAVTLANAANNFVGPVSATTNGASGVSLTDVNAIVLANINTTGTLTVNAVGITQLAGSTIAVTGLTTLNGGAGVITLTEANNDFIGAVSATNTGANAISLRDVNNILLGTVNTANNLTVTSLNDITQNGGGVTVGGTSSFTSTVGNVLLNVSPNNNFTGDVSANAAGNVAISDLNAISLGTVMAGGSLSVIANGVGTITDTGVITVNGNTDLTAGGDITRNSLNTFTGTVQVELVNSSSLTLVDTTPLTLDRLNPGTLQVTNLNITASGITQVDTLIVTGTTTLNGGAAAIALNDTQNDFIGAVTISNTTNASIDDLNTITFGAVTTTGDFTVDAGGNVVLNGATNVGGNLDVQANPNNPAGGAISGTGAIVVTGTTLLETGTPATAGNAISLNNAANDFGGAVTITSANDASLDDLDDITFGAVTTTANFTVDAGGAVVLAATTVGGNLDIEADANNPAGGAINGAGIVLVTGTTSLDTGTPATAGNDIALNNAANDFTGAVTIVTANDASLNDANGVTFGPVATSANFTVDAGGAIALNGLTTVGGNLDLEADTNNAAGGAISGTGAITVTGTTTLETGAPATAANDITLTTVTNNFIGAVTIVSANDASLDDANGITFGTVNTNANLDVDAAGAVDFTGVATIGGTLDVDTNANGGASGTITDTGAGQLLVTGLTTLDAGATNDITLDNAANNFSVGINGVTVTAANDVSIDDANGISFGVVTTSGGGNFIVDAGGTVFFDGLVTVTGNLDVDTTANNAAGGGIFDAAGRLLITGTTLLTAGNNAIQLDTTTNNFGGAVTIASATNASLDDANNLTFAGVAIAGNLVADAAGAVDFSGAAVIGGSLAVDTNANGGAGGTITDSTGSLIVGTTTTLDAGTSAITLDNVANEFMGAVTITAATNATLDDVNALTFGAVTISGNLDADSAGVVDFSGAATIGGTLDVDTNANGGAGAAITETGGPVVVTGTTTLDAVASAITLTNAANNFINAVTITAATNASLDDANAITFNNVSITGTLDVDAAGAVTFNGTTTIGTNLDVDTNANGGLGGDITDGVAGVLTVTGNTTLDAGTSNVTLDTITNNYTGTVTVSNAANVVLVDANSLNIAGINATGTVTATARGDNNLLTISGAVAAGGAVTFNADDMNITAAIGAAGQTVTLLPFNAGDAIKLGAVGETVLNTLELSAAEILLIGAANLVVGNTASGPITISATIMTAGATNVTLTTGINNSILFSGAAAQLNANGGNVTLNTDLNGNNGIVSGGNATDILANVLTLNAGQADIGASGNPLTFDATTLVTNTGLNGQQFLSELNTVTWNTSTATAGNSITLEGGTFFVGVGQTITASVLNVNAGATLGGNGTVNATVTGAGNVAPGTSPGILTINGAFNPTGTTTIELNAPYATAGVDFDRLIVNGTINLGGSMLVVAGGAVAPAAGTIVPIILNDGVDAITGLFNFADGAMVAINNFTGFISYFGGDGNDVTLTVASVGAAIFDGTAGSDVFEIRQISETIQVLVGGVIVGARPIAAVTPLGYTINGLAGNDSLNVNYGASGGIFNIPVTFNGGSQTVADSLTVNGGAFNTVVAGPNLLYSVTGTGAGTLTFDNTGMVDDGLIVFTGLEPVTVNSALGIVTIDIDNAGVDAFAGPITTTILDAAGANLTVDFDVAAEDITFSVPSVALNILGDNDGNDIVTVTSVDGTFRAALSIDGQGATDVINVATSLLLGSATSTGNLALSAETINVGSGAAAITLATDGSANAGTVTLTATTVNIDQNTTIDTNAATTDAVLTVNGAIDAVTTTARTLTLDLGTTSVMLNNAANNFSNTLGTPGVAITSAANVTLVDAATATGNGISLGNISMTGNLIMTSSGVVDFVGSANNSTIGGTLNINTNNLGAITDTGTGSLTVTGVATLAAGAANDITLNNVLNDFSTVVITSGNNVTLRDANAIDLGASTVSGNLSVTTTNGAITDSGNVSVVGNANFAAGGALGTITLGDAETANFGTLTFTATGAVSIVENSATVLSGASSAASLTLTSTTGSITDATGTSLTVTNNATFLTIGAAQAITLGDDPTDTTNFGSLTFFSTGAVSISENSAMVVTGVNAANTLALTSETGSITDAAATVLAVTNGATFTTTGAGQAITLGDNAMDVTTFGTLTFVSTGAVSISENDATVLTGNNSASSLVLISETATITDAVGTTLNVTNNAAFTTTAAAQAITLGDDPTDTTNFRSLTFTSTGAVSISENSATVLTGINTANALTLTSETGSITDNAGTSLTVTNNATLTTSAAGQAITLGDNAADTTNFGTLTFVSTGAVSISENGTGDGVDLTGVSTANSLVLIAEAGTIEDVAASSLTVTGNASFTSTGVGSGITLGDAAETTDFGTLTFNSNAAVSISENGTGDGVDVTGVNTALTLVLTAEAGSIEDAANNSLTVTNNALFTSVGAGSAITLGDNAGDTTNFGTLSFVSVGNVTITEDTTMNVAGVASNTSAALTLTSQTGDVRVQDTGAANDINASGAVTINVPTNERFFISDASTNILSGGAVTIAADKMSLTGTISAAGQTVTLRPFSTTDAINVGSADNLNSIGNTLELSDAELDLITAANLVIGNAAAATGQTITVLGVTTPANAPNVTLVTGGNSRITFFNNGSLTATGNVTLTTSAAGTGGIDSGNAVVDVTTGAASLLTISTGSGGIGTLAAPLTLATGTISTDTSSSNAGQFLLSTQAGAIGVVSFNAGTGTITLLDGDYTLTGNEVINNLTDITLTSPATIAMAGFTETFDALNGTGNVGGAGLLILGANNQAAATHSGVISGSMGVTKIGTGTQTLAGANTYNGQTIVNGTAGTLILSGVNTGNGITDVLAGTLLVNGSTASFVTVSLSGVLGGSGTINNSVTLQAGSNATFAPGSPVNTIADLAIVGNLTMNAGTTYSINVNGATPNTQHDQTILTGNVILGGATLVVVGTINSVAGQEVVLIANVGLDTVTGNFAGLLEGATVTVNAVNFFISYQGGAGGNDVTLTQLGPATYTSDGAGGGALELRMVTTVIGSSVQFVDDNVIVDARPLAAVRDQLITVNGTNAQNETLTVNYTTTAPASGYFDVDVAFNGGVGGADNDALIVNGGTFTTVTHTFTTNNPEHSGNIAYNTGAATSTISYTGLEPISMIGNTTTALTFVLPTGANTATLSDDANAGDGESLLSSAGSFENTTFANPTGTLTITGNTGADNIIITSVDSGFAATLAVNGAAGSDTLSGTLIDVVTLTSSSAAGFNGTENSLGTTFTGFETINNTAPADGSLTGQNADSTWDLDGSPTYTTGGNTLNFSGFATLIGGSNSDTFNISAATTVNLIGGDGADTFAFINPVLLTGTIDGGLGSDTLVGDNDGNAFVVTGADTGTLAANTTGGWSNVENLTGGTANDTFTVNVAGSLTGAISGLAGIDTLDLSAVVGASATITALNAEGATLNPVTSIGGGASGINVLTGQGTGTLTGENADRTWNLGATQAYTDGLLTLTFSAFATLQGGSGADTFNVTAPTVEVLNGGAGADLFDIGAALAGSVNGQGGTDTLQGDLINDVTLTGSTAADGFSGEADAGIVSATSDFTGIDNVIGTATLTGRDVVSTWTLNGTGTYFDGTATIAFSGFTTLQGGTDSDTFNVTGESTFDVNGGAGTDLFDVDAPLNGMIAGQAGVDTLQGSLIDDVTLTGSLANDGFTGNEPDINGGAVSFAGIDTLTGNGGALTGEDVASTWNLDGSPTYNDGANTLGFTGFENLVGGSMDDAFNVTAASTFNLFGGGGDDVFDIDAVLTGSIAGGDEDTADGDVLQGDLIDDVTLFGAAADGYSGADRDVQGSFSGINTITGNGGRLIGEPVNSTWLLDGTPTYNDGSAVDLNFSGFATLQGNAANDTFTVTAASPFTLLGGAGNDRFTFNGGRLTNGGFADDEAGADTFDGTGAIPAGVGQTAGLTLFGGAGNDTITGSSLNDLLNGGDGNDSINAAAGNDTLSGGTGNNTLNGGAGTDCVTELVTANATLTNTSLISIGNSTLVSIECAEIIGNAANNLIDASAFTPVNITPPLPGVILRGGDGNDTLIGTSKNDALFGDAGLDTVRLKSAAGAPITATNNTLTSGLTTDELNSIEALDLTGHATVGTIINAAAFNGFTTLTGGAGRDILTAGQKASLLKGNGNNDILTGGLGDDLFYGGAGNDTISGGLGHDIMRGEDGNDSLEGGIGDDRLFGDAGRDRISGGAGQDSMDGGSDNDTLLAGDGHDSVTGGLGNDLVSGGSGDDRLSGDAGNDTLLGEDGNDVLSGAGGRDLLMGGAGNDRIDGGGDKDTLAGQGGNDTIMGSSDELNEFFIFDIHRLLI